MPAAAITLEVLRRFSVARSLFRPTTLRRAMERMSFVQADPIRAPARAQDLILHQRVHAYRAGDLDRAYRTLDLEEDFFVNYGFVTRRLQDAMHPRAKVSVPADGNRSPKSKSRKREQELIAFVVQRGTVHPREAEEYFSHGRVRNYWGGSSHATTQMLDALHYRGWLRVAGREKGIRLYEALQRSSEVIGAAERRRRIDRLVDVVVNLYAPLPGLSLSYYIRRLRYAVPQWAREIPGALVRAQERLASTRIEGETWFWPNEEKPKPSRRRAQVRLLSPFDPLVHDRRRFERFWGWSYRFEAYTPVANRKLGYYALPLLWGDRIIGWANLSVTNGKLTGKIGYVEGSKPAESVFDGELAKELERMRRFLRSEAIEVT